MNGQSPGTVFEDFTNTIALRNEQVFFTFDFDAHSQLFRVMRTERISVDML